MCRPFGDGRPRLHERAFVAPGDIPFGVYQRNVAGLNGLLDVKLKPGFHRSERRQLLFQLFVASLCLARLVKKNYFRFVDAKHGVDITCSHVLLKKAADSLGTICRHVACRPLLADASSRRTSAYWHWLAGPCGESPKPRRLEF